jgi:RNA polymerase sigma-70 factor (ECF subfamily)
MDDFAAFYGASKDAVFRALLAVAGDRHTAEDAVAEAYSRALARWRSVARHPNPTAWVIRTALNAHRSWWRRLVRERLGPVPEAPAVTGAADGATLSGQLRAAVQTLPRRQREVLALRLLADLSAEQTAQLLGIGVATVHVHLHRALATLRAQLPVGVQEET